MPRAAARAARASGVNAPSFSEKHERPSRWTNVVGTRVAFSGKEAPDRTRTGVRILERRSDARPAPAGWRRVQPQRFAGGAAAEGSPSVGGFAPGAGPFGGGVS